MPTGMNLYSGRVFVKAGPHSVASAFIQKHTEMVEDDIGEIEHSNANSDIGSDKELTIYPHLRELEIAVRSIHPACRYTVAGARFSRAGQLIRGMNSLRHQNHLRLWLARRIAGRRP